MIRLVKSAFRTLGIILPLFILWIAYNKGLIPFTSSPSQPVINKEISIITDKIEHVTKMVMVEGTFSEVYSHQDSYKMMYDFLSFEKKAILKVKAKAALSVDMKKLKYEIDKENKRIIFYQIPEPEMMIESDIQYYDIQESTFNEFTLDELNKMNREAVEQIKEMVRKSNLFESAKNRVVESIRDVAVLADYMDWEFIDHTQPHQQFQNFDDIRITRKIH